MMATCPVKCPRCGSVQVAAILYAHSTRDRQDLNDLRSGRALPAGRPPTGNDPRWRCRKCHYEWGHPHGLSGLSADENELA